jgi:MYXO-CTERM domain-containing protein
VTVGSRRYATAALIILSLAASPPALAKAPPSPPGPARPVSKRVMIVPVPEAPGHYLLRQHRVHTLFTAQGLTMQLTPAVGPARELQWGVSRARAVQPQPLQPLEARFNQFVGPRASWKRNLPTWSALHYPAVAPGVDLWFEAREGGVQYSLRAERGADLREVRLEWRGAQELRLAGNGRALEVKLPDGELREEGLQCGQEAADGTSREVPCRYREVSPKGADLWEYVIEVDVDEPGRPAWVDPVVQWNTFDGNLGDDSLENITALRNGNGQFFVVGSTGTNDLNAMEPLGLGTQYFQPGGNAEAVISRRNADGSVVWTSILGGTGIDFGKAFAIGAGGGVYVAGSTTSEGLGDQWSSSRSGPRDGFIARLDSGGSSLDWFKYIGGPGEEEIVSLTLGQDGKLYAAGWTTSTQMPASDAGPSLGMRDLFVSRIHPDTGALERTLVLSGRLNEEATSIATGEPLSGGTAVLYITGYTESPDFPTGGVGPIVGNSQTDGGREAVVLKLNEQLGPPLWVTFLGANAGADEGRGVMYVPDGSRVMVVGTTRSSNFPNSNSGTAPPGANAFLATFRAASGVKDFSTVVGGSGDDEGAAITTGSFGSVYIGGKTTSTDLPVPFGFDSQAAGTEGFIIRMGADGGGFLPEWGTYAGGALADEVRALASDTNPDVLLIGGTTRSGEMLPQPLRPSTDDTYNGGEDMFLLSLAATDLTPPMGQVQDGIGSDKDTDTNAQAITASWSFTEDHSTITEYVFGAGTAPGCANTVSFRSVGLTSFVSLTPASGQFSELRPGNWYFATVIAKNQAGLENRVSSDGFFLLFPDGGPSPIPPAPGPVTPCPGEQPDGGTPDAGVDAGVDAGADAGTETDGGGGQSDGGSDPESPVGWSCGCGTGGGPTGLLLLVLVALGLRIARREA